MMISFNFLIAYLIGGITFIPFTIILLLSTYFIYHQVILPIYSLYTYFTFKKYRSNKNNSIQQHEQQLNSMDTTSSIDSTSLHSNEETSTTSTTNNNNPLYKVGWLKVFRGGQDQEEEEKDNNSIGDMVISYISGNNKKREKANNYFAVLKYSTLYLYDSEKQLDCKGVILLQDYKISTWPPGLQDFELFSKPHTIQLKSKNSTFYVNCNKCIDKEDWFFTFIRASSSKQQQPKDKTRFDQSAMNHLITMVHSDEHHFQTQWLNAILGRLFFGVYKTELVKTALYKKVMSKLDKINSKRPPFLGEINVRSVDPGHALPHFTQPKLLGLSPTGELTAEAYMQYDGGFRIEIETSLLWKYSDRLKPLTLDLVLGITLKEIAGKLLIKIKEPPTNRFWYGFYECPKMEWKVEPVVWEKRVGYSVVVKAIETKIQEFIMETMVLPHFDDITFFPTNGVGGIFEVPPSQGYDDTVVAADKKEKEVEVEQQDDSTPDVTTATTTTTTTNIDTTAPAAPSMKSSTSATTATTTTTTSTTTNNNKKHKQKEQQKEQHRNDEALLTTAKSLPELFASASASTASSFPSQVSSSKLKTQIIVVDENEQAIPTSNLYTNSSSSPTLSTSPTSNFITKNINIHCSPRLIPSTSATTTTITGDEVVSGQIAISSSSNPNSHDSSILSTSPDSSVLSTSPTLLLDNLTQVLTDDSSTTSDSTSLTSTSIQITYSQDSGLQAVATTTQQQGTTEDTSVRLRKSSSLALLRPKTGASTAVNVSPAMAHKTENKKDLVDSISTVTVV